MSDKYSGPTVPGARTCSLVVVRTTLHCHEEVQMERPGTRCPVRLIANRLAVSGARIHSRGKIQKRPTQRLFAIISRNSEMDFTRELQKRPTQRLFAIISRNIETDFTGELQKWPTQRLSSIISRNTQMDFTGKLQKRSTQRLFCSWQMLGTLK